MTRQRTSMTKRQAKATKDRVFKMGTWGAAKVKNAYLVEAPNGGYHVTVVLSYGWLSPETWVVKIEGKL